MTICFSDQEYVEVLTSQDRQTDWHHKQKIQNLSPPPHITPIFGISWRTDDGQMTTKQEPTDDGQTEKHQFLTFLCQGLMDLLFSLEIFLLTPVLNSMCKRTRHTRWYDFYCIKKEPNIFGFMKKKQATWGWAHKIQNCCMKLLFLIFWC